MPGPWFIVTWASWDVMAVPVTGALLLQAGCDLHRQQYNCFIVFSIIIIAKTIYLSVKIATNLLRCRGSSSCACGCACRVSCQLIATPNPTACKPRNVYGSSMVRLKIFYQSPQSWCFLTFCPQLVIFWHRNTLTINLPQLCNVWSCLRVENACCLSPRALRLDRFRLSTQHARRGWIWCAVIGL